MFVLQHSLTATYAAAGQSQLDLRRFLQTADGMPLHLTCIDLKLLVDITPHAGNDTPGSELSTLIDRIVLKDCLSNDVVNIRGRHLRTLVKAARGWAHADPAALTAGGDQTTLTIPFSIPFHGDEGGILGFREFVDCIQPMDRFRETVMLIYWANGIASGATINSASLHVSFRLLPLPEVVQGADIRWTYIDHADDPTVEFPVNGIAYHTAIIQNSDLDHVDYTVLSVDEFSYLSQVNGWQLVSAWNEACCEDVGQHELITAPQFMPVIYQDKRYSVQGAITFPGNKMIVRTTNTHGATQDLGMVQIHDSMDLAGKLAGRTGTVYQLATAHYPKFAKKNFSGVEAQKASRLVRMLGRKMIRTRR